MTAGTIRHRYATLCHTGGVAPMRQGEGRGEGPAAVPPVDGRSMWPAWLEGTPEAARTLHELTQPARIAAARRGGVEATRAAQFTSAILDGAARGGLGARRALNLLTT
jgi:hypothetical protein